MGQAVQGSELDLRLVEADDSDIAQCGLLLSLDNPAAAVSAKSERADFAAATSLIDLASNLAAAHRAELEVDYGREMIGAIDPDGPDAGVRVGFLEEWGNRLG